MELFDDYTKATFPLEIVWHENGKVRLLAAFANGVVGVSYHRDSDGTEYLSQALNWDDQGRFAGGKYPDMDLPPPPGKANVVANEWQREADAIQTRLDANPDAPEAWRAPDEQRLAALLRKIGEFNADLPAA